MDTITFLWTLAATFFAGLQLFTQKIVAHERRDSAFNGLMMYGVSGVMALAILITLPWPKEWIVGGLIGLSAGLIHAVGNYIRIESLKYIDTVIYFPINKVLGPVIVVAAGVVLFADSLSLKEYIGIALSLSVPLLLLSAAEHHRQRDLRRGVIFLLMSTILTSISVILTKQGLVVASAVLFVVAIAQIGGATTSALILFKQKGIRAPVAHVDRRDILLGFFSGTLGFVSFYTLLKAMSTGALSLVYVIQAHYILIPIILSIWWYGEHVNFRKVIAVVVSCLAILLLYN